MTEKLNRRDFIKQGSTAICGAGLVAGAGLGAAQPVTQQSTVVEVFHPAVVAEQRRVDQTKVREMLQRGLKGIGLGNKPWSKLIKPDDRVGLKINTLGRPLLSTHDELVQAVIEELKGIGVKENNIIVWDRFEGHMVAGKYALNTSAKGPKCYGSEPRGDGPMRYDKKLTYKSKSDNPDRRDKTFGAVSPFSTIFTKDCTKIINLAILKDHALAGVTLCLKNLAFGLTGNNARFHRPAHIGPFIADICATEQVKKKVVLHVIDGLEGCFDNGPLPRNQAVLFAPQKLWLGLDPVALDAVGRQVIEAKRKEKGLLSLAASGRPIDHVELAAAKGLGVADINNIKIKKIKLTA